MKKNSTILAMLLLAGLSSQAQNQITTPSGQPLTIGNNGVKLSNLNSGTATAPSNGKVLSVDANGLLFLAPDQSGAPSQWNTAGSNINYLLGNVGIGTATPLQRLHVNGDINLSTGSGLRINNVPFLSAKGTRNIVIGTSAGYSINTAADNVFLGANAGYTTSEGTGNSFFGTFAGYHNIGSGNTFFGANTGLNNTTGIRNVFLGNGSGIINTIGNENTAIGNGANFGTNNLTRATAIGAFSTVNCSSCIVLGDPSAKVGIGINTPLEKLHISGGTIRINFANIPVASGTLYNLYTDADGRIVRASTSNAREAVTEDVKENWIYQKNDIFNTNSGNVIIGNSINNTPKGYKLFVSDGILTEKVKVAIKNTSDWSDFVFNKDYNLLPLNKVEQYIKKNKHLPGVPSAKEVTETGIDLAKMDAILLQKIEELTLHLIEISKQNEKINQENRDLMSRVKVLESSSKN